MSASAVVFYILSFFILAAGLLAVASRKIFRSAIWLLFSLTGIAGLYFWLQMEFIAAVQIVVYVGGIVVLIIFSIFLTQQSGKDLPAPVRSRAIFSVLAAGAGFMLTWLMIRRYGFHPVGQGTIDASVGNIGAQMLSTSEHGYVLPFEVISILLLAAMIGCIVIAIKTKPEDK
ncbi:NADH-quinone oxidoreductase subunit J [Flavitalea sp. BT771]|uniref:NADH-quinone oxidoreductase subunit J family protein n=1 Tax=Flavitalea sp. BT771 TaxID=3063329 RepID=UPI0026E1E93F|nr:NADH-quinone oxidoreductase subunit J [Flavitalea sp. BT771]MDO6429766.1 NADH-quinone oxidoreductase subunit J [Flavitalea sp. BT771]MDV6218106.1 NADH-quinone oxidoreductase subunit J [Flavitalea sp. BT771]